MIRKLLYKNDELPFQFIKGMQVGLVASVVDMALLFYLTKNLHCYYMVSATISFLVGLTVNYLFSVLWIFEKSAYSRKWLEFGLFLVIGLTGLLLNDLVIWGLTQYAHMFYLTSKLVSIVVIYSWNFTLRKKLLFS